MKNRELAITIAKRMLVDSIWKSAVLEGFNTTFPKTEEILENLPVNATKDEILFIVNMKRAWNFLLDNLDYPVNIGYLEELNKIVGNNLFYGAGSIRTLPVSIGGTNWTPGIPVRGVIMDTLHQIDSECLDIRLKALKLFCFVARTQMFLDGNKRVAQLIANKVLIDNGVGIFQIPIEAIDHFKHLLVTFYETGIDDRIIAFMQDYCIQDLLLSNKKYTGEQDANQNIFKNVNVTGTLNLSSMQVVTFNKIFSNLKKLLKRYNYCGSACLYGRDGYAHLSVNEELLASVSLSALNTGFNSTNIPNKTINEFIIKTIQLLSKYVNFSINAVYFSVSEFDFYRGTFKDSKIEKGAIDIVLE